MTTNSDMPGQEALVAYLYQLADDKLMIGHRDSEWLGLCPDIEGDVALSSIAQDEVGHAAFYYGLLQQLGEEDPDSLAFARPATARRNALLLERPNGDYAYTIVRHLCYDLYDRIRLQGMTESSYLPLQHGAAKMLREEYYHLLHMKTLVLALAQAGGEAKQRVEQALQQVWPDLPDLFDQGPFATALCNNGITSLSTTMIEQRWLAEIETLLEQAGLAVPTPALPVPGNPRGRYGEHSPNLDSLLATMTEVYSLDPAFSW